MLSVTWFFVQSAFFLCLWNYSVHYPNYAFHKRNRLGSAIREGDFKLIARYDDGSVELYNLATDIGETTDLSNTSPEMARRLKRKLDAWLEESGAKMPIRVSVR